MYINENDSSTAAERGERGPSNSGLSNAGLTRGFLPAFRHLETGEIRLCRMENGEISQQHLLNGLPEHWVMDRGSSGSPSSVVYAIEPGFMRGPDFWTLADLRHPALDG